jgi:hypothetical protein
MQPLDSPLTLCAIKVDDDTLQAVARAYAERRERGCSDLAAHHAALIVLRDRLPSQPLRHAAATVRGIIAAITGRGTE